MNKTAIIGFLMATVLPLSGYFIVKHYSKTAVSMPGRYFIPDTVLVSQKNGKTITDTVWHKVKTPALYDQFGKPFSFDSVKGKIIVVDFFFSRCPSICPALTRSMKRLQDSFKKNDSIVHFVSISVDPEHDSVPQLRKFADRFGANHDTWSFVSGSKKDIYDFANYELKANIADPGVDTAFIHTENFFLLDTARVVRGFYNGLDTLKLAKLARDIPTLMLERDKKKPSFFRNFIPILPIIFIAIAIVFVVMFLISRKKNKDLYA